MYLIKNIYCDVNKNVIVENGIGMLMKNSMFSNMLEVFIPDSYWGKTSIYMGVFVDFTKFPKVNFGNLRLLSYVNEYDVKDIVDGYKEFIFHVSTYQPDKIEGYILFVKKQGSIKTNGEKLFGRYSDECVVVLRDGEYLEFAERRVEVINNKLVLFI